MQWLIDGLLAVHVLAVSATASAPLVCMPLERRSARGELAAAHAGRFVLVAGLVLLAFGAALGLIAGWLRWDDGLAPALARLRSKVEYGVAELVFSAVLMLVHVIWWRRVPQARGGQYVARQLLALFAGTNLVYHFPVLFSVISHLLHHEQTSGGAISSSEFRELLITGQILSRAVHIALASLIAACALLWVYAERGRRGDSPSERLTFGVLGARLALAPVLLQIPVGFWAFVQLTPLAQRRLLGGDPVAAALFVLGLAAALWLAHLVAGLALGEADAGRLRRAVAALAFSILLMTLTSRRIMMP